MTKSKGINRPKGAALKWLSENAVLERGDACIMWPFSTNADGYGFLRVDGKNRLAHREVCRKAHGEPPTEELHAAHSCRNPGCINKKHLRWATPTENNHDRKKHGTDNAGTRHGMVKLTDLEVLTIVDARARGDMTQDIADQFDVSRPTVSLIVNAKTWRHLERRAA